MEQRRKNPFGELAMSTVLFLSGLRSLSFLSTWRLIIPSAARVVCVCDEMIPDIPSKKSKKGLLPKWKSADDYPRHLNFVSDYLDTHTLITIDYVFRHLINVAMFPGRRAAKEFRVRN